MEIANMEGLPGLYGSMIKPSKNVGYCKRHGCYLTVATMKKHGCLGKQCRALDKNTTNDFWRQHEQKKTLKKANKAQKRYSV